MTECGARYGQNPDRCYLPAGHGGQAHTNRYGCTWPLVRPEGIEPPTIRV